MKYIIESHGKIKRKRWFINNEFGICIEYLWFNKSIKVSFDTAFLEEGCDEELDNFIDPLTIDPENYSAPEIFEIDYPAPWFLTNPDKSTSWHLPPIEEKLSSNFAISISSNYVFSKATELEKKNLENFWTTKDDIFRWDSKNVKPASKQDTLEHQLMAKVWISNAWVYEKNLNDFMMKEFGMEIEDDTFIIFSPSMRVNK
jgi:hypothetical protein